MNAIPVEALDAEISKLTKELRDAESRIVEIRAKLKGFEEFRANVIGSNGTTDSRHLGPVIDSNIRRGAITLSDRPRRGKGTTQAILDILAEHPGGLTGVEIIDAVADHVHSKASNPRHTIRTTLSNMARSGKLERDNFGRYHVPPPEDE